MSSGLQAYLRNQGAGGGLSELIEAVAKSCVAIADLVRFGAAGDLASASGAENVQGEVQKKLDILANDILLRDCAEASGLKAMASEEMDDVVPVRDLGGEGWLLLFDPLDGSSNIDVNVSIGTIFSILPAPAGEARPATEADFLQTGRGQAAAGYVVYGPQTTLVLTIKDAPAVFTLAADGSWTPSEARMSIPAQAKEFAINASNHRHWSAPMREHVEGWLAGADGPRGRDFNMRWIASMVADVHRVLTRGGVFLYPWDKRMGDKAGKLRLLYEANPMALLVERAGGASFDGEGSILDTKVTGLHQRTPVMMGARDEIAALQGAGAKA